MTTVGAEDASRAEREFLKKIVSLAVDAGAVRFRYADTLGLLLPSQAYHEVLELGKFCSLPIDFHGHNDFGMAVANAVEAFHAGANVISCAALGLGERAGHTSLEEFTGALHFLMNEPLHIDFAALGKLLRCLSRFTGIPVPPHKPLFGRNAFTHSSGIHSDGQLKDRHCYEPIDPRKIGRKSLIIPGQYSGTAGVKHLAGGWGITLTDEQAHRLIVRLQEVLASEPGHNVQKLFRHMLEDEKKRVAES